MAVGMVALIAMAGFAVDVSAAYHTHRRTQAAADAAAMAAAEYLPESTSQASSAASSVSAQNLTGGTVTTAYTTTYTANDTVTATAKATSPGTFTKVVGINLFNATATATARSAATAVGRTTSLPGRSRSKSSSGDRTSSSRPTKPGQGNFGGAQLPILQYNCALGTGGNDYRDLIDNLDHSCLVQVGDKLQSKTGNLAGPTFQGLNMRVVNGMNVQQNFDPYTILK